MGMHTHWGCDLNSVLTLVDLSRVTQDDIHAEKSSTVGSCSNWAEKGIVGRGVLLDFYSWAQQRKPSYNPLGTSAITMDDILTLIAEKNIQTQPGDILFLRTGKLPLSLTDTQLNCSQRSC